MPTLFLDESGDFETADKDWIVAGLFSQEDEATVQRVLIPALRDTHRTFGLPRHCQLHLTDLRRDFGHEIANQVCGEVINRVLKTGLNITFYAVVNRLPMHRSDRESRYRLTVLDLVALMESGLPRERVLTDLSVYAATRAKEGIALTTEEQLRNELLTSLAEGIQVGFTSSGLLDLVSANAISITMKQAQEHCGLIVADFISNTIQNRKHPASANLIRELESRQRLRIYESVGSLDERRARIAFRDGDFGVALLRTARLVESASSKALMSDCWKHALLDGPRSSRAHIERLIQAIHSIGDAASINPVLARIESAFPTELNVPWAPAILYRLRSYMLRQVAHTGDVSGARRLIALQQGTRFKHEPDPEVLSLMLEEDLIESEAEVNSLEFDRAASTAKLHEQATNDVYEVYCLLGRTDSTESISPYRLKARMNRIRCETLRSHDAMVLEGLRKELLALMPFINDERDRSRAIANVIFCLLRLGKYSEAVSATETCQAENPHLLFWKLRAINDALLGGLELGALPDSIHSEAWSNRGRFEDRHPFDLIYRELGLLERHLGISNRMARRNTDRSTEIMRTRLADSSISRWLIDLNNAHLSYILEKSLPQADPDRLPSFVRNIWVDDGPSTKASVLLALRVASPY